MTLLAHKIELRPTQDQIEYLDKSCGCKRHCYNQLLEHFSQEGVKWSKSEAYLKYKDLQQKFDFYGEISSRASRNAIDDLGNAYTHFFRRNKQGKTPGYPRFKRRGIKDSFALREKSKFRVDNRLLRLEKLPTKIKMRQELRFSGTPKQVTITKVAGKYFASILVETDDYDTKSEIKKKEICGVDLGIVNLAILSDGTKFARSQPLNNSLRKLRKLDRNLSRKIQGSNRHARAKLRRARVHHRVTNQRSATLHHISDYITKTYETIVLEDLDIKGMVKKSHRRLARSIMDCGWYMLRQQIEYKATLRNCHVIIAPREYPSSKRCSGCGSTKDDLSLSQRIYKCEHCGLEIDRDINASINLMEYGRHTLRGDPKRTQEVDKTRIPSTTVDSVNIRG